MDKVRKLQHWGLVLWLGSALAACTAPNYNGIWLLSVVLFVVGSVLLGVSVRRVQ